MGDDWHLHLPFVLMAYRSSLQESTGCSPNYLMFGREINGPIDLMLGRDCVPEQEVDCLVEYVEWMQMAITKAFEYARERMKLSVKRQDRAYKTSLGPDLVVGNKVWYHYAPQARKKLGKFWQGPYEILDKFSDITFRIGGHGNPSRVVHRDDLKLMEEPTTLSVETSQ